MPKGKKDGVTIIKPGCLMTGICNIVRWVILHILPNIRLCLCWVNVQEAFNPECLVPTVKHGGGSVMIWAPIPWYSAGPVITTNGWITASDYVEVLGNQVHSMVQMLFPNYDAVFSRWQFTQTYSQKCSALVWGTCLCTSTSSLSSTITIERMWSVLKSRVRNRFTPSLSLKQLAHGLHAEW